ncbi:SDR family oxidoreductase [Methylophaga sp.]|uniref:SDR family oxidoreductase n=1 Tax=Methylophaga sp. TaxID=2024840 RepID=UPI003F695D29
MFTLKENTIVLTGAAGGIGQAVAGLLDKQGASLILTDINATQLDQLNETLGNKHYTVEADLSSVSGRQKLIQTCQELMRQPSIVINIAGINRFAKITDYTDDQLDTLIRVNLTSQIALSRDFLPLLRKQPKASIINVGSVLGSIGMPGYSVYCATKFGLRGFSESLARELSDTAVDVRYFAPRATQTALNDNRVNEMNEALGNTMDSPELVASELVSFLGKKGRTAYLGWPEKLFVRINSLFPALVDQSFRKQLAVIKRYL